MEERACKQHPERNAAAREHRPPAPQGRRPRRHLLRDLGPEPGLRGRLAPLAACLPNHLSAPAAETRVLRAPRRRRRIVGLPSPGICALPDGSHLRSVHGGRMADRPAKGHPATAAATGHAAASPEPKPEP